MIRGIHHVSLVVDDLDTMLAFYKDVIGARDGAHIGWEGGMPEVDEIIDVPQSSADVHILRMGNAYLEIFKFTSPPGTPVDPGHSAVDHGFRHMAFDVTDIDSEYQRLVDLGVKFNCAPQTVEVEGHPLRCAYFRDPEGNIVEFQELLEGAAAPLAIPGIDAA